MQYSRNTRSFLVFNFYFYLIFNDWVFFVSFFCSFSSRISNTAYLHNENHFQCIRFRTSNCRIQSYWHILRVRCNYLYSFCIHRSLVLMSAKISSPFSLSWVFFFFFFFFRITAKFGFHLWDSEGSHAAKSAKSTQVRVFLFFSIFHYPWFFLFFIYF